MSTYTDNRGFTKITHRAMTFDDHCKGFPTEFIQKGRKAYAYLSYIPWDECTSTLVYFVTGINGDEFGQFKSRDEAVGKLTEVEKS